MATLAYQQLPDSVTRPLLNLASQLISLTGIFAVGAILILSVRAWLRYDRGADFIDLWKELLVILFCAAVAMKTFDIANWFH
ncbi:hypothetical protein ACIRRA_39900 [Nocardia sp. NPDC101769]|uniref:hypothetical protein n=1 Tax=Nocardia sp. NPDC101769 TaxID=3364333 RepID=UPI003829B0B9